MLVKTEAVVLSALRYQEKSLIVKCFTQDFGLKTYFIRNAFAVKNKGLNSAYFQPLNLLLLEANHKNKSSLEYINELKLLYPYQTVAVNFLKNTVCIFLAEVLSNSIKEEQQNADLYLFIKTALVWFDQHEFTPDFHLWFLLNTSKYLGFYPDDSHLSLPYFNPYEGSFTLNYTPNCLDVAETDIFKKVFSISITSTQSILSNAERKLILQTLLNYYTIHVVGFKQIKSVEVLVELFT